MVTQYRNGQFARDVCSRVVFMHQGRVHEIGKPEEVFADPKTPELKQFLGVHQQETQKPPCSGPL